MKERNMSVSTEMVAQVARNAVRATRIEPGNQYGRFKFTALIYKFNNAAGASLAKEAIEMLGVQNHASSDASVGELFRQLSTVLNDETRTPIIDKFVVIVALVFCREFYLKVRRHYMPFNNHHKDLLAKLRKVAFEACFAYFCYLSSDLSAATTPADIWFPNMDSLVVHVMTRWFEL